MRSVVVTLLLVAGLGTGAWFWYRAKGPGSTQANGSNSPSARPTNAVVERGNVSFQISVAGEIGPSEQVSVRPEVNGKISELPVDVGDPVKKGGLLFALDDRDLRIEVESRQKQIESAKLQLDKARIAMEQAKRDFDRDRQLFEEKLLSAQAFEASRERSESSGKDYELAKNSIERGEKEFDLAKERLLKTRIEAPFDCTVLTRPVSAGQAVSGSGGFNSGTEVLTIADLSSMVINAHVNQADVTRLKQGMEVEVEVDAIPGLKVLGQVERIAPQATVKNNIKGYGTRIVLRDVDSRIQPGMTASISIPVSAADNVLTVPLAAVFTEQGERYVYVKNGEQLERRTVIVGVSDFFKAEIKSGLNEGDVVSFDPPGGSAGRIPGGGPSMSQSGTNRGTGPSRSATTSTTAGATARSSNHTATGSSPTTAATALPGSRSAAASAGTVVPTSTGTGTTSGRPAASARPGT